MCTGRGHGSSFDLEDGDKKNNRNIGSTERIFTLPWTETGFPFEFVRVYTVFQKELYNFERAAYTDLSRGHTQCFEVSECSKTHQVLPQIVMVRCDFHW
jgi:hypothetical protein